MHPFKVRDCQAGLSFCEKKQAKVVVCIPISGRSLQNLGEFFFGKVEFLFCDVQISEVDTSFRGAWGERQGLLKSVLGGAELFFIRVSNSEQVISLNTRGIQPELLVQNVYRFLEIAGLNEFLGLPKFWRNRSRGISGVTFDGMWLRRLAKTGRCQCESENYKHSTT